MIFINKKLVSHTLPKVSPIVPFLVRQYHEKIVDHFENPRNVGSFPKDDQNVFTGLVGSMACGDLMRLQLKIDENGFIKDSRFKTFGCGSAIASSSFSTELVKNKDIHEAGKIKNQDIAKHLSLAPIKLHCSMLAEDAIKEAVRNYKKSKKI